MFITRIDEIRWIVTDQHFGHDRLRKIARPNFSTLEEMHEHIIKKHNEKVQPNDVVLFLGDLGFRESIMKNIPKLNGYKILILGNHDNYAKSVYNELFDEVYDHPIYYHKRIVFSHTPVMVSPGTINVHGHIHDMELKSDQHFNACPEIQGYSPISIKKINKLMSIIPKENIHFLQEWWAEIQIPMLTHKDRGLVLKEDGTIDAEQSIFTLMLYKNYKKDGLTHEEAMNKLKNKKSDLTFY
jgi:calcineurin-like phosphoesterase family protein